MRLSADSNADAECGTRFDLSCLLRHGTDCRFAAYSSSRSTCTIGDIRRHSGQLLSVYA